jgi:hypothetical protein
MIHHPIDLAAMMREAGWTNRAKREIALAVCLAESGGDDQARNENLKEGNIEVDSTDWGLMQINDKWQPQVSLECALDPVCNLKEAHAIYAGRDYTFTAWSAYMNGSYKRYLHAATVAVEAEIRMRKLTVQAEDAVNKLTIYYEDKLQAMADRNATLETEKTELTRQVAQIRSNLANMYIEFRDAAFKGVD